MEGMKLNEVKIVEQLSDSEFLIVIMDDGSIGKIRKSVLIPYTGIEYKNQRWVKSGWHRIAIGINNNLANSALINIGNDYGDSTQSFVCFYFCGSGYLNRNVTKVGGAGSFFQKCRIVYKSTVSEALYLDVYYTGTGSNNVRVSISSSLGTRLSGLEDVIATIPEGYSVQEFEL